MQSVSQTYCPLPWAHLYVGPDGKVAPCCVGKHLGDYGNVTLEETWNSNEMKQLRLDMLSNVKNDLCSSCYSKEDMGFTSMRQSIATRMPEIEKIALNKTNSDGSLNDFVLTYLDIRFNNLCNFKCRSCNPMFSSSIAVENIKNPELQSYYQIFNKSFYHNENIISEVEKHYEHVKHIYFAGGEPMMQEEHWDILKYFVDSNTAKNVSLIYSTNTSKLSYKNNSVFDYWKHFSNVHVQMSIDCEGTRAEYWRDGTVWEDLYSNIKIISSNNIRYSIHSVISWVNIYSYIELVKLLLKEHLSVGYNLTIWCIEDNIILHPKTGEKTKLEGFSLQSLPNFKKEEIATAIDEFILYLKNHHADAGIKNIITNMENIKSFMFGASITLTPASFAKNNLIDKIRGKDFFKYFPEHENMRGYISE
jgi:MoaA/NifB/PqqE/SkfB family radical SAM enzyme